MPRRVAVSVGAATRKARPGIADIGLDDAGGKDRQVRRENRRPFAGVGKIFAVEKSRDVQRDRGVIFCDSGIDRAAGGFQRRLGARRSWRVEKAIRMNVSRSRRGVGTGKLSARGPLTRGAPINQASVLRPLRTSLSACTSDTRVASTSAMLCNSARRVASPFFNCCCTSARRCILKRQ